MTSSPISAPFLRALGVFKVSAISRSASFSRLEGEVEWKGDRGAFKVRRKGKKEWHHVDLVPFNGKGSCDCADWRTRIGPKLKRGEKPEKPCCVHIEMAALRVAIGSYRAVIGSWIGINGPESAPGPTQNQHQP